MDVNTVGYTSQITAGFRAVELAHSPHPILVDHLAQHLAGDALQTALADYQKLQQAQGTGHSLRVPARNRVMDDYLLEALQQLQHSQEQRAGDFVVQVVNIGCGMVSAQRHAAIALCHIIHSCISLRLRRCMRTGIQPRADPQSAHTAIYASMSSSGVHGSYFDEEPVSCSC
jgi:hypothetical protein